MSTIFFRRAHIDRSIVMRAVALFFSSLGIFLGLTACGPTQSTRDSQTQQINSDNRKTASDYKIVAGTYKGTVTSSDDNGNTHTYPVVLRIRVDKFSSTNAGTSTPVNIPTLAGSLSIYTPVEDLESFNSGSYDPATGEVTLYAQTGGSANLPAGQGMQLLYDGKTLSGAYNTPGRSNYIKAARVATPSLTPSTTKANKKDAK